MSFTEKATFVSLNASFNVIYGGTFDPFHKGHEAICNAILAEPMVSELRIVPCAVPALKGAAHASAEHRVSMLEGWAASLSDARVVIDDQELSRTGPSYSLDTVRQLQQQQPTALWVMAMGADSWNSLPHWHGEQELRAALRFWVFYRAQDAEPHSVIEEVADTHALATAPAGAVLLDSRVQLPVASSALRQQPDQFEALLPSSIADYINKHGLYSSCSETTTGKS